MGNNIDPDQIQRLIRVYNVCAGLHVPILKVITVLSLPNGSKCKLSSFVRRPISHIRTLTITVSRSSSGSSSSSSSRGSSYISRSRRKGPT